MAELEIKCLTVSSCYTNCYVCCNKDTKEGFIVDPGDDFVKITNYINSMDMKVVAIILTHGHFDHIGAVDKLKERYDLTVYASEAEKDTITDTTKNLTSYLSSRTAIWKPMTARSVWTCVPMPDRGLILSPLSMRGLLSGRWKSVVSRRISET